MKRFEASHGCTLFAMVRAIQHRASAELEKLGDPKRRIPDNLTKALNPVLFRLQSMCQNLGLNEAEAFAEKIRLDSKDGPLLCTMLIHDLDSLCLLIENEMDKRLYFTVRVELNKFYQNEKPAGEAVFQAFPSARFDLTEAGNCLVCGNNVAAVFHLMRASEVALWTLGRDRQIPLSVSGKIEFAEWGLIISELEDAVKAIQQWQNSHKKEEAHQFYNKALVSIRAFNDGWRRHAAHVRPSPEIEDDEALALWGHVSRFLTTLSAKIAENKVTPTVW